MHDLERLEKEISDTFNICAWESYFLLCRRKNIKPNYPKINDAASLEEWKSYNLLCRALEICPRIASNYSENSSVKGRKVIYSGYNSHLKWMAGLYLPDLEELYISGNERLLSLEGFSEFESPNLRVLHISNTEIRTLDGLAGWSGKKLESLEIKQSRLTTLKGLNSINLRSLVSLDLSCNSLTTLEDLRNIYFPSLYLLSFDYNRDLKSLEGLFSENFAKLESLSIAHTSVSDVDNLERYVPKTIRCLEITDTKIDNLNIDRDIFLSLQVVSNPYVELDDEGSLTSEVWDYPEEESD